MITLIGLMFMIGCTTASKNEKYVCAMEDPDHPGVLVEVDCPDGGPLPPEANPKSAPVIVVAEPCNDHSDDLCEVD